MSSDQDTKPDPKPDPTTKGKSPAKPTSPDAAIPILNPAWADEAVKARGLTGALAKAVADDLAREVTKQVAKAIDDKKVDKIVGKSFNAHLGITRGA
jgi:hypothetical protein